MKKCLKYFLFWLEGSPWAIPCRSYVWGWWFERVHNLETRDTSIYCSAGKMVFLVLPFCFISFFEDSFSYSWYPAYSLNLPVSAHSEVFTRHALSRLRIMDLLVQLACTKADHTGSAGFSSNNTWNFYVVCCYILLAVYCCTPTVSNFPIWGIATCLHGKENRVITNLQIFSSILP